MTKPRKPLRVGEGELSRKIGASLVSVRSDPVRFEHTTRVVDLDHDDFLVRTESRIFVEGQEIDSCAIEDYASTYFMARVLDRAWIESEKNNPRAIASRIVASQRQRAEEKLLRKVRN